MIKEILTYPDKRLKQESLPVTAFDSKLHQMLDDMYDTMIASNGVGLAAIQIGIPLNALIINIPDEDGNQHRDDLIEVINPEITHTEGSQKSNEGCLSVPEYYEDVDRAAKITVTYHDRHGQPITCEVDGFLAIAFQHEIDHLKGSLFIDKISILKRKRFDKEFKKIFKGKKRL